MIDWMIRTFFDKKDKSAQVCVSERGMQAEKTLKKKPSAKPEGRVGETDCMEQFDVLSLFEGCEGLNTYERKRAKAERLLRERAGVNA